VAHQVMSNHTVVHKLHVYDLAIVFHYSYKSHQNKVTFAENERSPLSFSLFTNQRMLSCSTTHLLHLPQVLLNSMTITPSGQGASSSHSICESRWKEMSSVHYNC